MYGNPSEWKSRHARWSLLCCKEHWLHKSKSSLDAISQSWYKLYEAMLTSVLSSFCIALNLMSEILAPHSVVVKVFC